MTLQPYWITLQPDARPTGAHLGVGITARSEADARMLFEQAFGRGYEIATIVSISDMRMVEQNHVATNMGNFFVRGVWFPLGG